MSTHRLILLPGSIGGSNEEIDHHPITHVETVFHRPKKKRKGKRYQKYPFYTQQQCASDHKMNQECVCVCVCRLMLLPVWNIEKPKEVLLHLCSRKGTINQPHPPSARLQSCLCCAEAHVCACLCTVDGSSSRRPCGTRWRWWRASWALPRRPRPTGAPTDRLTGSVTLNCPAGWGWSITEAHKHTSKLFELHWLYINITHLEGSLKWPVCAPGCIYRMCGAVGSMLIMGGLVSLVGRNAAVHKPVHTTGQGVIVTLSLYCMNTVFPCVRIRYFLYFRGGFSVFRLVFFCLFLVQRHPTFVSRCRSCNFTPSSPFS